MADEKELTIKVAAKVEAEALKQMESALQKQIVHARALGKESKDLEQQLGRVQSRLKEMGNAGGAKSALTGLIEKIPGGSQTMELLAGGLGKVATVAAVMTAGLVAARRALDEFASSEVNVTSLDAALAQQGKLTEEYRVQLQELASEMSGVTAIDDSAWVGVLATLTKFGAGSDGINQAAEAVKNLAGFLDGDLQQASVLVGKALQGNFDMLGRYGIQIDRNASQTERLQQMYEVLAQRGGGQLEARANTLTGQFTRFTIAIGDTFKGFGNLIARTRIVQAGLWLLIQPLEFLVSILPGTIERVEGLENKLGRIPSAAEVTARALNRIKDASSDVADSSDAVAAAVKKMGDAYDSAVKKIDDTARALVELRQAQAELAQQEVGLAVAKGEISTEEGDRRKRAIQHGLSTDLNRISTEAEQKKVNEGEVLIDNAARQTAEAQARNEAARARLRAAGREFSSKVNGDFLGGETDFSRLKDKADAALADAEKYIRDGYRSTGFGAGYAAGGAFAGPTKEEIDRADQALEVTRKRKEAIDEYIAAYEGLNSSKKELEDAVTNEGLVRASTDPKIAQSRRALEVLGTKQQTADLELQTSDAATGSALAAKREELNLETEILEAKARGEEKEARRLEWQREYNRLLKEGIPMEDAIRSISAKEVADRAKGSTKESPFANRVGAVSSNLTAMHYASIGSVARSDSERIVTAIERMNKDVTKAVNNTQFNQQEGART